MQGLLPSLPASTHSPQEIPQPRITTPTTTTTGMAARRRHQVWGILPLCLLLCASGEYWLLP